MHAPPANPPARRLPSELALVLLFVGLIAVVPVSQILRDLRRGERVQCMDVFRQVPTAENLREFETTLKQKSWIEQAARPAIQRLLFQSLNDTGAKAILGPNRWLFYRPDVRYLVEPDRPESDRQATQWVRPHDGRTQRDSVVQSIVRMRDALEARGIHLLVVPVPGKPSVYPDQLTRRSAGDPTALRSPTLAWLAALERHGVATIDLFRCFQQARQADPNTPLYLAQDTHWTPAGARLAAQAVATKLRERAWAPAATNEFRVAKVHVRRWGDLLEMMQIPGLDRAFAREAVECEQVLDMALGPLLPHVSDRPGVYRYPGQKSSVLVLGDSFSRIYQFAEPRSLGERPDAPPAAAGAATDREPTKRLLPGAAGFIAQLARELKAPVDAIYSDGGASTDVRRKLSTNPEILEGKRVVIWEFVERDIALGRAAWEDVDLPARLDP